MTIDLERLSWPVERLGEALEALGKHTGFALPAVDVGASSGITSGNDEDGGTQERWIETIAARLGLEAEAVEASYPEVEGLIGGCAPALLRLAPASAARFLVVLAGKRRRLVILGPELSLKEVPAEAVRTALCREIEATVAPEIDILLESAGIPGLRRTWARAALLNERLANRRVGAGWLIRPSGTAALSHYARESHLLGLFITLYQVAF